MLYIRPRHIALKRPQIPFGFHGYPLLIDFDRGIAPWALDWRQGYGSMKGLDRDALLDEGRYIGLDLEKRDGRIVVTKASNYDNHYVIYGPDLMSSYEHISGRRFTKCRMSFFIGKDGERPLPEIYAFDEVDGYLNYIVMKLNPGDLFQLIEDGNIACPRNEGHHVNKHRQTIYCINERNLYHINTVISRRIFESIFPGDELPCTILGHKWHEHFTIFEPTEWVDLRPKPLE